MKNELTSMEKDYIKRMISRLKRSGVNQEVVEEARQQVLEHIQECHSHGDDSLKALGDPVDFAKEYMDINNIRPVDRHDYGTKKTIISITVSFFMFVICYMLTQLFFTLFLTTTFLEEDPSFDFNLIYRITEHRWWNALLIMISFSVSVISTLTVYGFTRKRTDGGQI